MEPLTAAILLIALSGALGGTVLGIAARTSHKLRIPFWGKLTEIGFLGDALVGASAGIGVFFLAAPLLNITLADSQTVDEWVKIISLGVLSGLAGVKFLTSTTSYVNERIALLDDRMEQIEKSNKASELIHRADALALENRLDHALSTYEEALRIDPRNESALLGKAKVLGERCQWSKALHAASRVVQLNPSSGRAYYHRARYKNMAGTYPKEDILEDLRCAASLDPHYKNYAKLHDKCFENLRNDDGFRRIVE